MQCYIQQANIVLYVMRYKNIELSNDSSLQIPTIIGSFTKLQQKILSHIGRTYGANYRTLGQDVPRNRITIRQSVESLIKHQYVAKKRLSLYEAIQIREHVGINQPMSLIIFLLTHKGIATTWLRRFLGTEDMVKGLYRDDNITKYINVVYHVFTPSQHRQMLEPIFRNLEWSHSGFEEEKSHSLIKDAFLTGILKLAFENNYDPSVLFNKANVAHLKGLFSHEDLKRFKEKLKVGGNNIALTIKKFPV
jgi:hypothetical protein